MKTEYTITFPAPNSEPSEHPTEIKKIYFGDISMEAYPCRLLKKQGSNSEIYIPILNMPINSKLNLVFIFGEYYKGSSSEGIPSQGVGSDGIHELGQTLGSFTLRGNGGDLSFDLSQLGSYENTQIDSLFEPSVPYEYNGQHVVRKNFSKYQIFGMVPIYYELDGTIYYEFLPCIQTATNTTTALSPYAPKHQIYIESPSTFDDSAFTSLGYANYVAAPNEDWEDLKAFENWWTVTDIPRGFTEGFLTEAPPSPPTPPPSDDPYKPGGEAMTGGGDGTFDAESDLIPFAPTRVGEGAVNCGFVSLYNPDTQELRGLSNKLWEKTFVDSISKLFSDPMEAIISLMQFPCKPNVSSTPQEIGVGLIPTGVQLLPLLSQYKGFSMGSVDVQPYYGAYLDYSPYTKISIYLPFIGVRQLNTDEIMGQTLSVTYQVDFLTGACVAEIAIGALSSQRVLYTFNGNVASNIPVSGRNFSQLWQAGVSGALNTGISIALAAASGGAMIGGAIGTTLKSAADVITSMKPQIERAGNMSANVGFMSQRTPYLIYEIPRLSAPANNNTFMGYPSNITYSLSELTGFTTISDIHIEGIPCTDPELSEIESLLRSGVIL